ncbi:hypothetical protein KYTH76_11870 [Helicobacter pylori]
MAVRFNNNSEWMEEMQILFDKINNGSPFGVIRLDLLKACFLYMKTSQTGRHDFGKDLDSIDVELSNPNTFVQSLLKLGSFLHGKTIESFDNPTNYPPITLPPLQTPVEIEEHRKNTTFDQNYNSLHYRQSSTQNIKINEIANDLESGKIVGEKIISDALLGVVSCCFKKLLSQDQINLYQ